jgi:hypothetical protein
VIHLLSVLRCVWCNHEDICRHTRARMWVECVKCGRHSRGIALQELKDSERYACLESLDMRRPTTNAAVLERARLESRDLTLLAKTARVTFTRWRCLATDS